MSHNKSATDHIPYIHNPDVHNIESPEEIVKVLVDVFHPSSVVDVGCGIGTFVRAFKNQQVNEVKGIDGPWVNRKQLEGYMDPADFIEKDLQLPLNIDRRFDLAISLEVAEHLEESSADTFIKNLTSLSDLIVFSAAIPGQFGQNHINSQWISYWQKKFDENGYVVLDLLRPIFWMNPKVFHWYSQNMFLVVKKGTYVDVEALKKYHTPELLNMVHPKLLERYQQILNDFMHANHGVNYYFRLMMKSMKNKLKV